MNIVCTRMYVQRFKALLSLSIIKYYTNLHLHCTMFAVYLQLCRVTLSSPHTSAFCLVMESILFHSVLKDKLAQQDGEWKELQLEKEALAIKFANDSELMK